MPPPSSYSAVDLRLAIQIFKDVGHSLNSNGTKSAEFEYILTELEALTIVLQDIENLALSRSESVELRALRRQAHLPLQSLNEFLDSIQRFNGTLGFEASNGCYRGVLSRARWAVLVSDELSQLRQKVEAQITGLRLLIQHIDDNILLKRTDTNPQTGPLVQRAPGETSPPIKQPSGSMLQAVRRCANANQVGFQDLAMLLGVTESAQFLNDEPVVDQVANRLELIKLQSRQHSHETTIIDSSPLITHLCRHRRQRPLEDPINQPVRSLSVPRISYIPLSKPSETTMTFSNTIPKNEIASQPPMQLSFLRPALSIAISHSSVITQFLMRVLLTLLVDLLVLGPATFMAILSTFRRTQQTASRVYLLYGAGYENILRSMRAMEPALHAQYMRILYAKMGGSVPRIWFHQDRYGVEIVRPRHSQDLLLMISTFRLDSARKYISLADDAKMRIGTLRGYFWRTWIKSRIIPGRLLTVDQIRSGRVSWARTRDFVGPLIQTDLEAGYGVPHGELPTYITMGQLREAAETSIPTPSTVSHEGSRAMGWLHIE